MAKNDNSNLILIVLGIAFVYFLYQGGYLDFMGASIGQGGLSNIVRDLPAAAQVGSNVVVKLGVTVDMGDEYYLVEEAIPSSVTYVSSSDGGYYDSGSGRLTWYVLSSAASKELSYTVTMPDTAQAVSFTGSFVFEGDTTINPISGDNSVSVQVQPPPDGGGDDDGTTDGDEPPVITPPPPQVGQLGDWIIYLVIGLGAYYLFIRKKGR